MGGCDDFTPQTGDDFRDELRECVDEVRQDILVDLTGRRLHDWVVVTRTWSGSQLGEGTFTDVELAITPKPKLTLPEPTMTTHEGGAFEIGDLIINKVSARKYTRSQLGDPTPAAPLANNVIQFWRKDGDEAYDVISTELRYLHWRVHLRPKRDI